MPPARPRPAARTQPRWWLPAGTPTGWNCGPTAWPRTSPGSKPPATTRPARCWRSTKTSSPGGADPALARVAVDQHLRDRADDDVPEYRTDDNPDPTEWEGRRGRRDYLPMISAREAAAFSPADLEDDEDALTGEQVAAVAELEAAAEELAARRYQVADEVLARYDALSNAGAPMPREQALDELRASIWSGADQAVHARGSSGALWQARLDHLDDLRTEQQRAQADRRADTGADTAVDAAGPGIEKPAELGLDRAEQLPGEAEEDANSAASVEDWTGCQRAVDNAANHVQAWRTERDEHERILGAELYEFLASHHTDSWTEDDGADRDGGPVREDGTAAGSEDQR